MKPTLRVGCCQTPEILADIDTALGWIHELASQAGPGVELLVLPECFLQGYLVNEEHVRVHALDLKSPAFAAILHRLSGISPTLVVGLIEKERGRYFNTAVVVAGGQLVGAYRKTHLMPGESVFDAGDIYPTFQVKDVAFGINICSDGQHPEPAGRVAAQGARLLALPAQNMMSRPVAEQWKDQHHAIRRQRVRETGMWLASADVTGERGERIAYGPTSILNPRGDIVAQVPLMQTGVAVADIS